jgi:metallophosphoesterase superfamily enzyme
VVHGDAELPAGRAVHGHTHPCLRGAGWTAPCYLVGAKRLVLPAFSIDAAGVNVRGVKNWASYRCCVIAGDRVLDFGTMKGVLRPRRIPPAQPPSRSGRRPHRPGR